MQGNFIKGYVSVQNTKLELSRGCIVKLHIIKVYSLLFLLIQCQFVFLLSSQHCRLGRETNSVRKYIWDEHLCFIRSGYLVKYGVSGKVIEKGVKKSQWQTELYQVKLLLKHCMLCRKQLQKILINVIKNILGKYLRISTNIAELKTWSNPLIFFICSPATFIKIYVAFLFQLFITHLNLLLQKST